MWRTLGATQFTVMRPFTVAIIGAAGNIHDRTQDGACSGIQQCQDCTSRLLHTMDSTHEAVHRAASAALEAAQNATEAARQATAVTEKAPAKKRKQVSLHDRRQALTMLGFAPDGTRRSAITNPSTAQPWTQKDIAVLFGVSKSAVTGWINNAKRILATECHTIALLKHKRIKSGSYPELEKAITSYMNDVVGCLRHDSPFRESLVREIALSIRHCMISTLPERSSLDNVVDGRKLLDEARRQQSFFASPGWYQRFMVRNKLYSSKGAGNAKTFEK